MSAGRNATTLDTKSQIPPPTNNDVRIGHHSRNFGDAGPFNGAVRRDQPEKFQLNRRIAMSNRVQYRAVRMSLAGLVLTALLASAGTANATTVNHCGNYGIVEGQEADSDGTLRPHFTDEPIDGAGVFDIVSAVTSCKEARRVVRVTQQATKNPCVRYRDGEPIGTRNPCQVRGYTCRYTRKGYELGRTRCLREGGRRVVQFDSGA